MIYPKPTVAMLEEIVEEGLLLVTGQNLQNTEDIFIDEWDCIGGRYVFWGIYQIGEERYDFKIEDGVARGTEVENWELSSR